MSSECYFCEMDLRGGHLSECPIEIIYNAKTAEELEIVGTTIAGDSKLSREEQSYLQEMISERRMDLTERYKGLAPGLRIGADEPTCADCRHIEMDTEVDYCKRHDWDMPEEENFADSLRCDDWGGVMTGRPTMNLETQRAVEQSVRHWGRILALVPWESPVAEQCPLCRKYPTDSCTNFWVSGINLLDFNDWGSCPIAARVGVPGCDMTPWADAFNMYRNRIAEGRSFYTEEERKSIRRERNWLRSFLPTLQMVPYV